MTAYYKITTPAGGAYSGGKGKWDLPKNGKPGKWRQVKGELRPCENGLHICSKEQLAEWIDVWNRIDFKVWLCEVDLQNQSNLIVHSGKSIARRVRLVKDVTKQAVAYVKAAYPYDFEDEIDEINMDMDDTHRDLDYFKQKEKEELTLLKEIQKNIKKLQTDLKSLKDKKKSIQSKIVKKKSKAEIDKLRKSF